MPGTSQVDPASALEAVATVGPRVSGLLRAVRHAGAPALGEWDLTDTAVHVSLSAEALCALVQGAGAMLADLWDLGTLNRTLVAGETTRELGALADRIDATVARFLALVGEAADDGARPWVVEGVEAPLSMLTCQMLNELVVHGWDIARAEGVPWPVERSHAALVLTGFVFPSMAGLGRALVNQETAAGVRATYDVRLRGGGRAVLRFEDGDLTVEGEPSGRVDCHLSVDPVAYMLVGWGRISQGPAILKGQLLAWGRKPWLGLKLRSLLRNP